MQEGHPIAYFNKALSERHQILSTYEKELMAASCGKMKTLSTGQTFHY